jgi:hypothetical protein
MGRLDNIIARDRERRRLTSNKVLWIAIAVLVVAVGIALLFTDSWMKRPPAHEHRVRDIKLMHAPK